MGLSVSWFATLPAGIDPGDRGLNRCWNPNGEVTEAALLAGVFANRLELAYFEMLVSVSTWFTWLILIDSGRGTCIGDLTGSKRK